MGISYTNSIDIRDYTELRKSGGWDVLPEAKAQIGLNNSALLVAAYDEKYAVGMARVIYDGAGVALITDVVVRPEYRGQGIGKSLLQRAMEYLDAQVRSGEFMMVNLMASVGKEKFYLQFGFMERPNENRGAGMTLFIRKH